MPDAALQPKPLPGSPCNGCGACCLATRCVLSIGIFGEGPGPCPGLERAGDHYQCGLVAHPLTYATEAHIAAGITESDLSYAAGIAIAAGTGVRQPRYRRSRIPSGVHSRERRLGRPKRQAAICLFYSSGLGARARNVMLKSLLKPPTNRVIAVPKDYSYE